MKKDSIIRFRLPAKEKEFLVELAKSLNVSLSDCVRAILEQSKAA